MGTPPDRPQWLPPEPAGPPPEVGPPPEGGPAVHPPPDAGSGDATRPDAPQAQPAQPGQPPPQAQPAQQVQPLPQPPPQPASQAEPPHPQPSPPYGYQSPPPPYGYQAAPPPYYYHQSPDAGPGNDSAVAAIVLAGSGLGLLLFSGGFSAPLSLVLGIFAIVYGRKGRRRVDAGETRRHRGVAQAGFFIGIATVVLSILAAVGWTLIFLLVDDLDLDGDYDFGDPDGEPAMARLVLAVGARAAGAVLA